MLSDIIPFPDPHFLYTSLFLILPPYGLYNITLPTPQWPLTSPPFPLLMVSGITPGIQQ